MSTQTTPLRRRRSEIENEEDADSIRSSQRSTPSTPNSSKRVRTNTNANDSDGDTPSESEDSPNNEHLRRINVNGIAQNGSGNGNHTEPGQYQPGSIVRVRVKNFVTYTETQFLPGPNLNMIIGPNGTGKSSLVCAICLGLGWPPSVLGRAGQIGEFVKHNTSTAEIETELMRRDNEATNHVIRLKIIKDGNQREWWLNGKKSSLKAVSALTKSLSIQIDNLCQFLPQDKVSLFAALSPVELLLQTQRAAAPEYMLEWHEALKKYRQEQKQYEEQISRDKERLQGEENRQEGLQAEVERLRQRQQIQERVELLKQSVNVVEYNTARLVHREVKREKKEAERMLAVLEAQVQPTLQSINQKHSYAKKIKTVITERKQAVENAEKGANELLKKMEGFDREIKQIGAEAEAEKKNHGKRREQIFQMERNLKEMEKRLLEERVEFNAAEWNEKTRVKEIELRKIKEQLEEGTSQNAQDTERGKAIRGEIDELDMQIRQLSTQDGQQISNIARLSKDTATAWKWVQEHQDQFEQEVYGPPLVTCSVTDPRYAAAIESLVRINDVLTITAQTPGDFKKLSDQLYGVMKLGDITLRSCAQSHNRQPCLSAQDMQQMGLDGWAVDHLDGPAPVISMLCGSTKLDRTAVSLQEINDQQYNMLANSQCRSWVTGKQSYAINRRAEYGPGATSTTTKVIRDAQYWTDRPIDTSAKRELEAAKETRTREFDELRAQVKPLRDQLKLLASRREEVTKEINTIKNDKAEEQKTYGEYKNLPQKIERRKEDIAAKKEESNEYQKRMQSFRTKVDHASMRKAKMVLNHKEQVDQIRICHEQLLDAEIRLIEAKSDAEALEERNTGIVESLERERQNVRHANERLAAARATAEELAGIVADIMEEARRIGTADYFKGLSESPDTTVETLHAQITAEEMQLQYIHATNPNAIEQFERRQIDIDKLKAKIHEAVEDLERMNRRITKTRSRWEPELDKLVAEISDAFSYNFESIGCAGQVGIHKDEVFEQWAIQIKVKFRENEALQILDQHRQSGGERSVSTIFYLMALQSLARSPFRVVDEINQGMDPRNERMVHERMVEIACKEHTSQYFLITPKLLTNLRYDRRMKVHCIASGEYMPEDHKKMDVRKVITIRRAMVAAA